MLLGLQGTCGGSLHAGPRLLEDFQGALEHLDIAWELSHALPEGTISFEACKFLHDTVKNLVANPPAEGEVFDPVVRLKKK